MWKEAKKRFAVGTRVRGTVLQHHPFGIFVDLGDPEARGLVQIIDFLDEGRMTRERYPPIGATIEAIVLGHTDDQRKQVWLSMKPSKLGKNVEPAATPDRPRD
jgi:ribosomal protein S1